MEKKNKVRTSITIDPDLLAEIRKDAEQSVSAYIERAVRFYREHASHECVDGVHSRD